MLSFGCMTIGTGRRGKHQRGWRVEKGQRSETESLGMQVAMAKPCVCFTTDTKLGFFQIKESPVNKGKVDIGNSWRQNSILSWQRVKPYDGGVNWSRV